MSDARQLIEAVEANDPAAIAALLAQRPKLAHAFVERPMPHGEEAWLPLHVAAAHGCDAAAAALLKQGARPDARTRFTNPFHARATALHLAAAAGHLAIVERLLNRGATLAVRDAGDRTPLSRAARTAHVEVVRRLIGAGAPLELRSTAGLTPLHEAIHTAEGCEEQVEGVITVLIEAGADVDARCPRDPDAFTPLHRCVMHGSARVNVARRLLEAGADPTIADPAWGRTPLDAALNPPNAETEAMRPMIELLRDAAGTATRDPADPR